MIQLITEGATKVATSVAESMRNAPGLLAVVILQGVTLGVIGYNSVKRQQDMTEERRLFAQERQMFIEQCVIPKAKEP
jgi:uncharacterized protein involved in propanediol utilization